ncbi:MAG: DUF3788 domain-containing protein [Deltaproteobacteria bacterium]
MMSVPETRDLTELMGLDAFKVWCEIEGFIKANYRAETFWDVGRKAGVYEYKFRQGSKTLCAFYAREHSFGFMVIFGKAEREKFEKARGQFSAYIQDVYDNTHQYHDGKWLMVDVVDDVHLEELKDLIVIKKTPVKRNKDIEKRRATNVL